VPLSPKVGRSLPHIVAGTPQLTSRGNPSRFLNSGRQHFLKKDSYFILGLNVSECPKSPSGKYSWIRNRFGEEVCLWCGAKKGEATVERLKKPPPWARSEKEISEMCDLLRLERRLPLKRV